MGGRPVLALGGVTVVVLTATACGSLRPKSDFAVLGSGAAVAVTAGPAAGGAAPAASGPASPGAVRPTGTAGGATGSAGTTGRAGTQGHTVTIGGGGSGNGSSNGNTRSGCTAASHAPGVTDSTITIGTINTLDGPFPPDEFSVSLYGVDAYVKSLNAHGGLCGRTVKLIPCNDHGDNNANVACAHQLVDQDHVLAIVGTSVFTYPGAQYVSQQGVPDIGGQPVDGHAYYTYRHMWSILGSLYPNDDHSPPHYEGNSGLGIWFKDNLHLKRAGVIYYAQETSKRGANFFIGWLRNAGVQVDEEQVPLLGDPSGAVQDMKNKGDQAIFDGLDISGNQKVCRAMQNYDFNVPKISTPASWNSNLGRDFAQYDCLKDYYVWEFSTNYDQTSDPQVKAFRDAYATFEPGKTVAQWSLDGWAAGMWFADATRSCTGAISRACIERFVDTKKGYSANGLLDYHTTSFPHITDFTGKKITTCISVAKWTGGESGRWETKADHRNACYTTPYFSYN